MLGTVIGIINALIKDIAVVITFIMAVFPDTPFQNPARPPESVNLGWVTWVLDFPTWILHFSLLLGAIGVYYFVRVLARWVKVVRN